MSTPPWRESRNDMSPLPIGDIEVALGNPAAYKRTLSASTKGGFGVTYMSMLRHAIFKYHSTRDAVLAMDYLRSKLEASSHLRSPARRAETVEQLEWYLEDHIQRRWETFQTRLNLELVLPSRIPDDFKCSGEVARIDLVPSGGYAAWLIVGDVDLSWRTELRFALIQGAIAARTLSVPPNDVQVGVCAVKSRTVGLMRHSALEVSAAYRRFDRLLQDLGY